MRVLSLFDGMACARIALDRVGINVDKYYACELDKYAIKVAAAELVQELQSVIYSCTGSKLNHYGDHTGHRIDISSQRLERFKQALTKHAQTIAHGQKIEAVVDAAYKIAEADKYCECTGCDVCNMHFGTLQLALWGLDNE